MDYLKQEAERAKLKTAASRLQAFLKDVEGRDDFSLKDLSSRLLSIARFIQPSEGVEHLSTMRESVEAFLNRKPSKSSVVRLRADIFKNFEFFLTTGLHIVAGSTGHGKTVWAFEWAKACALDGNNCLFLSFEMTADDIAAREITHHSELKLKDLWEHALDPQAKAMLEGLLETDEWAYAKRISVAGYDSLDWKVIEPGFLRHFQAVRPRLVVVDYLQMLSNSSEDESRLASLYSKFARYFKLFAETHDVAVMLLCQLNRKAIEEAKKAKERLKKSYFPVGHEFIKESGGIAEAADSVQCVIIPEKVYVVPSECPEELRGKFQVVVDKSRKLGAMSPALFSIDISRMKF